MRRLIAAILTVVVIVSSCGLFMLFSAESDKGYIDNSDVTPKYVPNSQVKLEENNNGLLSPDWIKTLIIEEVNVTYASENGMFSGMDKTLDHLQELGVNGLWLTPISAPSQYLNYGPHTVNPALTGTGDDYEAGWKIVAEFVEKAHQRNIRVFFDIVTWGVSQVAPIVKEHRDWFNGIDPKYNGYNYNWENEELVSWYSDQLVKMIERTNADGFRADTGVSYCGYDVYSRTRKALYDKGYYVCMFTEGAVERYDVFDFEECATMDAHFRDFAGTLFTETYNILDVVKKGTGLGTAIQVANQTAGLDRYYTATLSHHDAYDYDVTGDIIKMGYSGILSPFIPLWYIGDEWDNSHVTADGNTWLYGNTINWNMLELHRDYYEQVKLLIRIRRVYSDIFDFYPQNHRETNICAVETDHEDAVQAYARYAGDTGIMVVPNLYDRNTEWKITIPFDDMGLSNKNEYAVTDLLTGKEIARGNTTALQSFAAEINRKELGVFAIEPVSSGGNEKTESAINNGNTDNNNSSSTNQDVSNVDSSTDQSDSIVDSSTDQSDSNDGNKKQKVIRKVTIVEGGLTPLAIAGIVAGSVVVVGGIVTVIIILSKKRKKS